MPWETPNVKMKVYQEFLRHVEKLPEPLPVPHDPPLTYYNNAKYQTFTFVPYDLFYNFEEGFDVKSARDDRKSLGPILENIFKEEENKYIPVTTQLWYGRPRLNEKILDWSQRHGRASPIKDFYRRQGINISPDLETQPAH